MQRSQFLLVSTCLNVLLLGGVGFLISDRPETPAADLQSVTAPVLQRGEKTVTSLPAPGSRVAMPRESTSAAGTLTREPAVPTQGGSISPRGQTALLPASSLPTKTNLGASPETAKDFPAIGGSPRNQNTGGTFSDAPSGRASGIYPSFAPAKFGGNTLTNPAQSNSVQGASLQAVSLHAVPLNNSEPALAGNSFVVGGNQINAEVVPISAENPEPGVDIVMTPAPKDVSTSGRPMTYFEKFGGWSYEEQAFRAKWGWAAFDQAQRLAKGIDQ